MKGVCYEKVTLSVSSFARWSHLSFGPGKVGWCNRH
jgi:hypothetical protein